MTLHSENTRLEIHNPRVLNNALQTRHELQMRRVLLKADIGRQLAIPIHEGESNNLLIFPILSILKLANKAVTESSLVNEKRQWLAGSSTRRRSSHHYWIRREKKRNTSYLLAFGAVVAAASVRFHVWFVAGWVHAFVCQADHAFAYLL
jgi:hypothetical protein